jgi:hypothetical protein
MTTKMRITPLILALALALAAPCHAGGVTVFTASGTLGPVTLSNQAGTIRLSASIPFDGFMDTVNGVAIAPDTAQSFSALAWTATPVGPGAWTLAQSAPGLFLVDLSSEEASMNFVMSSAAIPPGQPDALGLSGTVTKVLFPATASGYDFSRFSNGAGTIAFAFTAASFTGTTDIAGVFSTPGASAAGSAAWSMVSIIPEPSTGLLGLLALIVVIGARRR